MVTWPFLKFDLGTRPFLTCDCNVYDYFPHSMFQYLWVPSKAGVNNKVERRSRFISSDLSPIRLLRSSMLHGKVGMDSASKRCRQNGDIVT